MSSSHSGPLEVWTQVDSTLRGLIRHAREAVPFYRRLLAGFPVVSKVTDLSSLPILDRSDVRTAGPDLVADGVDASTLRVVRTGGTSGVPLELYRDATDPVREKEHLDAARRRFGVGPEARVVALVGRPVGPDGVSKVDPGVIHAVARLRFGAAMLATLAELMLECGLAPPATVMATESSSEALPQWRRELIGQAFGVPHHN